jgi:homoserine/homoserine lactone efflux protein
MVVDSLWNYFIAVSIIVLIPGPNILLIMNNSMKHGFKNGLLTILGIKAGMTILFLISLSGITALLVLFSSLFTIIKWLGVAYLIYLGISQIIFSYKETGKSESLTFDRRYFLKGFVISVTNPKGLIFAGAFFPQFLNTNSPLMPQTIILCGGFIIVSLLIEILYAFLSNILSNLLKTAKVQKMLDRVSGFIFIVFGVGLSLYKKSN